MHLPLFLKTKSLALLTQRFFSTPQFTPGGGGLVSRPPVSVSTSVNFLMSHNKGLYASIY